MESRERLAPTDVQDMRINEGGKFPAARRLNFERDSA